MGSHNRNRKIIPFKNGAVSQRDITKDFQNSCIQAIKIMFPDGFGIVFEIAKAKRSESVYCELFISEIQVIRIRLSGHSKCKKGEQAPDINLSFAVYQEASKERKKIPTKHLRRAVIIHLKRELSQNYGVQSKG